MDWKTYESEIEKYFAIKYPMSVISKNVKMQGKLSGSLREIDILIKVSAVGYPFILAIECKHWMKKIDVAEVGKFIDKLNDIGISNGIMISLKGYSDTAYSRAANYFGMQLQVLSFDSLPQRCDFWTIIARKDLAVVLVPPNCWLVDANIPAHLRKDVVCYMHPFEVDLEEAREYGNLITIQLWPILDKNELICNLIKEGYDTEEKIANGLMEIGYDLKSELTRQDNVVKKLYPKSKITYWEAEVVGIKLKKREIHHIEKDYFEYLIGFEYMNNYIYCYYPVRAHQKETAQHRLDFIIQNLGFFKLNKDFGDAPYQLLQLMEQLKDPIGQPSKNVHPCYAKKG